MTTDQQIKLIAANEFSPGQLGAPSEIGWLLGRVAEGMDRASFVEAIRDRWFSQGASARSDATVRATQQMKRAANVVSGMQQYGLLVTNGQEVKLTQLGQDIHELMLASRESEAADVLGLHLLESASGVEVLRAATDIRRRHGQVTGARLSEELRIRGFVVPNNSSSASKLRQWLEWCGVVSKEWVVDDARLNDLLGFGLTEVDDWQRLTWAQREFVSVLHDVTFGAEDGWVPARHLLQLLDEQGVTFDRAQARRSIYEPLRDAGWIELSASRDGRHSKSGNVRQTTKSRDFAVEKVSLLRSDLLSPQVRKALDRPLSAVLVDLDSADTGTKGVALEVLAVQVARGLGMTVKDLRVQGAETGGAEVDLVVEKSAFTFQRWVIQCKNQKSPVSVSVVAKEVGVATLMHAHTVVVVTTSSFTRACREFATAINRSSSMQVILIDGSVVREFGSGGPTVMQREFKDQAVRAQLDKRSQSDGYRDVSTLNRG